MKEKWQNWLELYTITRTTQINLQGKNKVKKYLFMKMLLFVYEFVEISTKRISGTMHHPNFQRMAGILRLLGLWKFILTSDKVVFVNLKYDLIFVTETKVSMITDCWFQCINWNVLRKTKKFVGGLNNWYFVVWSTRDNHFKKIGP